MNAAKIVLALFGLGLALDQSAGEVLAQSRKPTSGNPAHASIMAAYQNRQNTLDRTHQNWSNYMLGVQKYHNPYGGAPLTFSNQYSNVWLNGLGQRVYSNNANFNPNYKSNLYWHLLQPVR